MIVLVILRRRSQLWPQIIEPSRWPVELKLKAAELQLPRLLREHHFHKVEVVGCSLAPSYKCR